MVGYEQLFSVRRQRNIIMYSKVEFEVLMLWYDADVDVKVISV